MDAGRGDQMMTQVEMPKLNYLDTRVVSDEDRIDISPFINGNASIESSPSLYNLTPAMSFDNDFGSDYGIDWNAILYTEEVDATWRQSSEGMRLFGPRVGCLDGASR